MKKGKTPRGFQTLEFRDSYNLKVVLCKSSQAFVDNIWIHTEHDKECQVTIEGHSSILLSRKQAKELSKRLNFFAKTGVLYEPKK